MTATRPENTKSFFFCFLIFRPLIIIIASREMTFETYRASYVSIIVVDKGFNGFSFLPG